jgi:hypothetical protein
MVVNYWIMNRHLNFYYKCDGTDKGELHLLLKAVIGSQTRR